VGVHEWKYTSWNILTGARKRGAGRSNILIGFFFDMVLWICVAFSFERFCQYAHANVNVKTSTEGQGTGIGIGMECEAMVRAPFVSQRTSEGKSIRAIPGAWAWEQDAIPYETLPGYLVVQTCKLE